MVAILMCILMTTVVYLSNENDTEWSQSALWPFIGVYCVDSRS